MDLQRLIKVAAGNRHKFYDSHVKLANEFEMYVTGEGLDDLMQRYTQRESDALFQQRKELTQHVIPAVVENILQPFEKVPRSKYQRTVTYSDNTQKTAALEAIIANFYDKNSVEHYLSERLIALNAIDPNAFLVIDIPSDYDASKGKLVQPYPFEAYSNMCVDYQYKNNELKYLIVCVEIDLIGENEKKVKGSKYTMYLPDRVMILLQTLEFDKQGFSNEEKFRVVDGKSFVKIKNNFFEIIEPLPYNLGVVPAKQVGYKLSKSKNIRTFVSPYFAAIPYLKKTLKVNSELDLTMANSAFPFSIRYSTPCPAMGCNSGLLANGKSCGTCKGTGVKQRPTSAMEEIEVALPNRPENIIDLDKLLVFKAPPIDILKFQQENIDKVTEKAKQIVFNADIFSREQIAQTATSKNIQTENLYDVLYPFARSFAKIWEFSVTTIAKYIDKSDGLVASMYFAKDLKMKTTAELLLDLKIANESGAGNEVRRSIQSDIMRNIYAEDNYQYVRNTVKEEFNPFSGMMPEEILIVLNTEYTTLRNKVLYSNLGNIFDELEREYADKNLNFYKVEKTKQRDAIAMKVDAIIAEIKENTPKTTPFI